MSVWVDRVAVFEAQPTLPDRWGFLRASVIPADSALTVPAALRIQGLYLAAHRTTPFRGSFTATSGGIRRVQGGAVAHPAWLLRDTGQLVRVGKVDPDTGAWGRNGTVVTVAYDHDSIQSAVSLDENRAGFQTLLARYGIGAGLRQFT